jgi:Carboxypeptidase regulatory-like domain
MVSRKWIGLSLTLCAGIVLLAPLSASGQDDPKPTRHGRKYKAPDPTSHIEVTVVKSYNGKPIPNAAVVFHTISNGKDEGNLEVKTDPDGKAIIDVIPIGSDLRVQVIANGFATFGQDYKVEGDHKEIAVSMIRPRAQVSAYTDNDGKASERKPGVQEPVHPKTATPPATPPATTQPAPPPASSTPPPSNQ